jgi:hypothetical protein
MKPFLVKRARGMTLRQYQHPSRGLVTTLTWVDGKVVSVTDGFKPRVPEGNSHLQRNRPVPPKGAA